MRLYNERCGYFQRTTYKAEHTTHYGRFPAGLAICLYCTGLSHGPVSAPVPNAKIQEWINAEL